MNFNGVVLVNLLYILSINWVFAAIFNYNNERSIRSIKMYNYNNWPELQSDVIQTVSGPRDEASIIVAPRRQKSRCKAGQLLDRRGKCRTPW